MIYPVDKITFYIKNIFDNEELLRGIFVRGEVSNCTESGGNAYFCLKGAESMLQCVCFAVGTQPYPPKNGGVFVVKGSVTFYKKNGRVSFYVTDIKPDGAGGAYLKFLELKDRLEKEGLFSEAFKKKLPAFPQKAGVVTSRSGAVLHDIVKVAKKRFPGADIVLYPVRVQGDGAEKEIAEGVRALNGRADVIIVARGGGSEEDLAAYNTEAVARAVFDCVTPVVSAVGHETDHTLCDLAADVRAATPTEAAEIAFPSTEELLARIASFARAGYEGVRNRYNRRAESVSAKFERIFLKADGRISAAMGAVSQIAAVSAAKDPRALFNKGYALLSDTDGKGITGIEELFTGKNIVVSLKGGKAAATVTNVEKYASKES
jgi:exodeoxyribonuclease VII large subunit